MRAYYFLGRMTTMLPVVIMVTHVKESSSICDPSALIGPPCTFSVQYFLQFFQQTAADGVVVEFQIEIFELDFFPL